MSNDKHYEPGIYRRLQGLTAQKDWEGLKNYLTGLSNAQFRTAGYMLGERIVPELAEANTWELVGELVVFQPKAFLVTMLKAIAEGLRKGRLHLHSVGCKEFLTLVGRNVTDTQKTLLWLLPEAGRAEDIGWLFRKTGVEEGEPRIPYLLRTPTFASAYALFQTLRHAEHDRALLVRTARLLMKRGDGLAFNLASLLRTYYGLEEVAGTFSLRVEPYQLARIESSFDAFCEVMRR